MSIKEAIRDKERHFAESYASNISSARQLQRTLERDILPGMVDELGLDEDAEQRALEWLEDLRMCRCSSRLSTRLCNTASVRLESIFRLLRVRMRVAAARMFLTRSNEFLRDTSSLRHSPWRMLATSCSGVWPFCLKRYLVRPFPFSNACRMP